MSSGCSRASPSSARAHPAEARRRGRRASPAACSTRSTPTSSRRRRRSAWWRCSRGSRCRPCARAMWSRAAPGSSPGCARGCPRAPTYTTAQDVTLWPIEIAAGRLPPGPQRARPPPGSARRRRGRAGRAAGDAAPHRAAGRSPSWRSTGSTCTSATARWRRRSSTRSSAPAAAVGARPARRASGWSRCAGPSIVGLRDDEALMPRTRRRLRGLPAAARILRDAGALPLRPASTGSGRSSRAAAEEIEVVFLLRRPRAGAGRRPAAGPAALRDAGRSTSSSATATCRDRPPRGRGRCCTPTAPGRATSRFTGSPRSRTPTARGRRRGSRRSSASGRTRQRRRRLVGRAPAAPAGRGRTAAGTHAQLSYAGDDVFLSLSRAAGLGGAARVVRVAPRALCTNRDLPTPRRPAGARRSRAAIRCRRYAARLAADAAAGAGRGAADRRRREPRRRAALAAGRAALAQLPRPRGRGGARRAAARHARALRRPRRSRAGAARPGHRRHRARGRSSSGCRSPARCASAAAPRSRSRSTRRQFAGHSALLLSALLARLFARYAAVNAFVQTRTRLLRSHEEVPWPITVGNRSLI